jgi:hypothetical protein
MAEDSGFDDRSSNDIDRTGQDAASLSVIRRAAGGSEYGAHSSIEEISRDPDSLSLSMVHRRRRSAVSEYGAESSIDNEFFFIGIDFGTTYVFIHLSFFF